MDLTALVGVQTEASISRAPALSAVRCRAWHLDPALQREKEDAAAMAACKEHNPS